MTELRAGVIGLGEIGGGVVVSILSDEFAVLEAEPTPVPFTPD